MRMQFAQNDDFSMNYNNESFGEIECRALHYWQRNKRTLIKIIKQSDESGDSWQREGRVCETENERLKRKILAEGSPVGNGGIMEKQQPPLNLKRYLIVLM